MAHSLVKKEAIFPLVQRAGTTYRLIGTGFCIGPGGLFMTAKHVVTHVRSDRPRKRFAVSALLYAADGACVERPIRHCVWPGRIDIAVGALALQDEDEQHLAASALTLTTDVPRVGVGIVAYGYPEARFTLSPAGRPEPKLVPRPFHGRLEEHFPEGRDRYIMPIPCYRGSVELQGGASGGPVCDERGRVFGVTATSLPEAHAAYFARILDALRLTLPERDATLAQLGQAGVIRFDPPLRGGPQRKMRD